MHPGDGAYPRLGFLEGAHGRRLVERIGLHAHHRRDEAEAVGDAMIDFMQQRFSAVARLPRRDLVFLFLTFQAPAFIDLLDGGDEQLEKLRRAFLDDIFVRAGADRRNGGARVRRSRDIDHRRTRAARAEPLQKIQSGFAGEFVVQRDDVDIVAGQPFQASLAVDSGENLMAAPGERLLDEGAQAGVVIDEQHVE